MAEGTVKSFSYTNKNMRTLMPARSINMSIATDWSEGIDLSPGGSGEKFGIGWACVLRLRNQSRLIKGTESSKFKFRMLLLAVVNGLKELPYPCVVNVHTSCKYLLDCGSQITRPKRAHASDSFVARVQQQKAKNSDLWLEFESLSKIHRIRLCPVREDLRHEDSFRAYRAASNLPYVVAGSTWRQAIGSGEVAKAVQPHSTGTWPGGLINNSS
jgi:ribonuclease HI